MTNPNPGTLIVTSAIQPPKDLPFIKLTDPQQRLHQTYCSLIRWIRETAITDLVLCDNTGTNHPFKALTSLARQHNKRLEILVFKGDHEQACLCGKGFGEGEIMRHVLNHSRLLQQDTSFYKVTGRVFVERFNVLHRTHASKGVVFALPSDDPIWKKVLLRSASKHAWLSSCVKHVEGARVETTFYKCTWPYYLDHLIDRYRQVDDRRGYYLEHAFLSALVESGFDVFRTKPGYVGQSASTGLLYDRVDYSNEIKNQATQMLG